MVTVNINFKELKKLVKKDLTISELDKVLFDMGMELDSKEGDELSVDVTPDRPDMVSLHGLARSLRAYLGIDKGMPKYSIAKSDFVIKIDKSVNDVRPYTVAAVVKNLHFNDASIKEMIWVQEKLHQTFARGRKKAAIGIYPLEDITPPITYFAEDPKKVKFQPLESNKVMDGIEILENHSTGKEFKHLLDGYKKFPFFKDAKGEILSMPPIINSHKTGRVSEKTKAVFIECSGSDLNALNVLLNILVTMFSDLGGKIFSVQLDYPDKKLTTPYLEPEHRKLAVSEVNARIGFDLNAKECKTLLEKMLYDIKIVNGEILDVSIPRFRSDIWHNVDIIDDVARAYGFNNLKPSLTPVNTNGATLELTDFEEEVSELLANSGLNEVFTFALSSKEDQFAKMCIPEKEHMTLGSTAEKSINMVRISLLPELMKVLVNNRSKQYPQKIFEVGDVVIPDKSKDTLSKNVKKLAIALCGSDVSFTDIKQLLEFLMQSIGLEYSLEVSNVKTFIPGRCGNIIVKKINVGSLGEVNPKVLSNWNLEMPLVALELDLTEVFNTKNELRKVKHN